MKPFQTSATFVFLSILLPLSITLSGCKEGSSKNIPIVVVDYYHALINKDYPRMVSKSCAAWESQAKTEFDSFSAVSAKIENLSCQVTSQEGNVQIVSCSGKIIANYGNEILEIDLGKQNYRVIKESGDWRFCGYQ